MKEILITSSVLILILLVLRRVFRHSISRRVQYALWGLVLLRLLIPGSFPALEHSVLTTIAPVQHVVSNTLEQQTVYVPVERAPMEEHPEAPDLSPETAAPSADSDGWYVETDETVVRYRRLNGSEILTAVWIGGMVVFGSWMLLSNLRFRRKLCQVKTPYSVNGCRYPVYLVEEGLSSPCLVGLFRPAIYLTPAAVQTPDSLRHILAHESAHAKHLDPLWALLRCVCLTVYWFDPLVWIAAAVSRTDGELACDESALAALGEEERIPYGRTLLSLVPVRRSNPMLTATTMSSGKRQLRERIVRIAEHRRTMKLALAAAVLLVGMTCVLTFTGAKASESRALTGEELTRFNRHFFNGDGVNIHNQFLSSLYGSPSEIDFYELFHCLGSTPDDETIRSVFQRESAELSYPAHGITEGEMEEILKANTGLTVAETERHHLEIGPGNFEKHVGDAWYWVSGDANSMEDIRFTAGTREGDTVKLYYEAQFYDDSLYNGWACVMLTEQSDGTYWFQSNQPCDKPTIPTAYPEGKPDVTIPLRDATVYDAPSLTIEQRTDADVAERLYGLMVTEDSPWSIDIYRAVDGTIRAAAADPKASEPRTLRTFLTLPDRWTVEHFHDLFGQEGVAIAYYDTEAGYTVDYCVVSDDGIPSLLLRTYGSVEQVDLDGDGIDELASAGAPRDDVSLRQTSGGVTQEKDLGVDGTDQSTTTQPVALFFQRKGQVYRADVSSLVTGALSETPNLFFGTWDFCYRSLSVTDQSSGAWEIYFDGNRLLLYAADFQLSSTSPARTLPDGEPVMTLSMADISSYEPSAVRFHMEDDPMVEVLLSQQLEEAEYNVCFYRSMGETVCAGLSEVSEKEMKADCFLELTYAATEQMLTIEPFENVLGHDGFLISYPVAMGAYRTEYYYFDEDGRLHMLFGMPSGQNSVTGVDLDGDGQQELIGTQNASDAEGRDETFLYFLRDGQSCIANLSKMIREQWPELENMYIDFRDGALELEAVVSGGDGIDVTVYRRLYLVGDQLVGYYSSYWQKPLRTPVWPDGEPDKTLILSEREPQSMTEGSVQRHEGDLAEVLDATEIPGREDVFALMYQSTDGKLYVGTTAKGASGVDCFFQLALAPTDPVTGYDRHEVRLWSFTDVLGMDGIIVYYPQRLIDSSIGPNYCFYAFDEDGAPYLLAKTAGPSFQLIDADGDGQREVFAGNGMTFVRDGQVHQADVALTLFEAYPELDTIESLAWYPMTCRAEVRGTCKDGSSFLETLCFDGERLLCYRGEVAELAADTLKAAAAGDTVSMTLTTADGVGGGTYTTDPAAGNGPNRLHNFHSTFHWQVSDHHIAPTGASVTVSSPDGRNRVQCWEGSDLVRCVRDGETHWLLAESTEADVIFDGTIFSYLRFWYDEAEYYAMRGDIVIPDQGQSQLEIAQAWVDADAEVSRRVTSGSKCANTYARCVASIREDVWDEWYPELAGKDHFYFSFCYIFVPESVTARNWQMAGNTSEYSAEERARYGDAPEDALICWRMGPMYRTEEGWRCDGVGTGP